MLHASDGDIHVRNLGRQDGTSDKDINSVFVNEGKYDNYERRDEKGHTCFRNGPGLQPGDTTNLNMVQMGICLVDR